MADQYITIVPLGSIEGDVLAHIATAIQKSFQVFVRIKSDRKALKNLPGPLYGKYNATLILKYLSENITPGTYKILAITDLDLYSPIFSCLYGEAQLGGKCALISIFRMRQEYYNLRPDRRLFLARCEKEAIHEIAHTMGLMHCSDFNCIMYPSSSIIDTDVKSNSFCQFCLPQVTVTGGEK